MKQVITKYKTNFTRINSFLTVSCCVLLLSSCSFSVKTAKAPPLPKPAEAKLIVTPNVVDVDVDFKTKVKGASKKTKTAMEAKDQAYYDAVANNNIDVLVDPVYSVLTCGKKSKAMVTGFAGHYKNIRTEGEATKTLGEATMKAAQATFEQGIKDGQAAFDAKMEEFDKKVKGLERLAAVNAVAKEDLKTYIISGGGAGNAGGEKVINSNPGIVDKFNALFGCDAKPEAPAAGPKPEAKEKGGDEPKEDGNKGGGMMMNKLKGMMSKDK